MVKMGQVYIQVHDPTLGRGKPHVRCWAVSSSSSSLGASPRVVPNPPVAPACPKGTPGAAYLSESRTPPGIVAGLRHLSVSRRGLRVPGSPSAGGSKRQSRVLSTLRHFSPSPAECSAVGHLHLGQKSHFLDVSGLLSLSIALLCAKGTWYRDKWHQ